MITQWQNENFFMKTIKAMKKLIILSMLAFASSIAICQSANANIVADSINGIIQIKNAKNANNSNVYRVNKDETATSNIANEKHNDFDNVNKRFAFVLFYRSTCPHCQRFDPVVKQFSSDFGFKVYAYTTDGHSLPSFPHSMPMTESVEKTFFNSPQIEVPSLFLINVKTMRAYLIDQGEMNYQDLNVRVKLFFHLFKQQVMS